MDTTDMLLYQNQSENIHRQIFEPNLPTWMKTAYPSPAHSTPLPSDPTWLKTFNAAVGDPDKKIQAQLAQSMQLNYCTFDLNWQHSPWKPRILLSPQ